jgi:hypothetical protein
MKLLRQQQLGKDSGMRLRLQWEDGYAITVHSWEAAAAIINVKENTLRQYWSQGKLAEGKECQNPNTLMSELCFFIEDTKARRGPAIDPERLAKRYLANQAKRDLTRAKLALAKARVAQLEKQLEKEYTDG